MRLLLIFISSYICKLVMLLKLKHIPELQPETNSSYHGWFDDDDILFTATKGLSAG